MSDPQEHAQSSDSVISFGEAVRTWAMIGLLSFGGPAGQIALMHKVLVDRKRWISERRFLHALNYCMMLPGPEAMQLATYVGWLKHGVRGGLVAGCLFVLPGFIAILALSLVYVTWGESRLVLAGLAGMSAAVVAIVIEALIRIGKRTLRSPTTLALAAGAFIAIFAFGAPFPLIVVGAAILGLLFGRLAPGQFPSLLRADGRGNDDILTTEPSHARVIWRTIRTLMLWLAIWWLPIGALAVIFGAQSVYVLEGVFFSKTAVVTFGGAYAVLAYVAQHAVEIHQWITTEEMIRGLAMAETTPGPLIMVLQFVGFLGAYRNPAPLSPIGGAVLASGVATWATFAPCFLWIFVGAPFIERLQGNRRLAHALTAITASIVGVILNLAVWFAIHTTFAVVGRATLGPIRIPWPAWTSIHWPVAAIATGACVLLFVLKWRLIPVLGACLGAAVALQLAGIRVVSA